MEWKNLIALLAALGGWDAVKYLINRKSNKRLQDAQADIATAQATTDEFHSLKEYNEFLQQQLQQKEERFIDQTERLRNCQEREFALMQENSNLKLELATKRCEVKKCVNRQPQNGY
jgi:flagellar motility protein MotE (MotC chaperone)